MEATKKCYRSAYLLGLAYYYRIFVKGFSMTATPMTRLLPKNVKYEWSEKCQRNFDKLKALLTKVLNSVPFRPERPEYSGPFQKPERNMS